MLRTFFLLLAALLSLGFSSSVSAQSALNKAINEEGTLPLGEDGKPLNLDFEKGTLDDWTATGDAFKDQPIKGEISQNREFGAGKHADMTGEFWIGGYEKYKDPPKGRLVSKPFKITHPWASFLLGGGSTPKTRVEIAGHKENVVVFSASGRNEENMGPVIVNLEKYMGRVAEIRIVDEESGGWGHVNFDDFRFYTKKPEFPKGAKIIEPAPDANELYPLAGVTAEEAAKAMQLPPGFKAQVGAAEPLLHQPIAMAMDDRGRIWVAEAYTYPIRAPEGQGKDRILIFEDTDLDGSLDSHKVFAENLNLVSGLEVGFGGVWVGAAPYLQFIPDANGDDLPDSAPKVLLDGWGYEDTHETLNAFTWGPDGWLYGCHGVFTHSNVGKPGAPNTQRKKINAGIWRYHPTRHEFEVFAEGSSNPWGLDFNDRGQAFITACVIPHLYHVIHNARYQRQAGEHFNPYTYADIQTIARHRHYTGNQWNNDDRRRSDQLGGGHAHAGAMIYLGGSWPEKYRNQIFMHNIHGNRINEDLLSRNGSGYAGDFAPDFMLTRDQWSQMIYLTYGPDGQAWMIDWYDANQCHHRDVNGHDRTNGRIYRVAYNNAKPVKVDLAKLEDVGLVTQLEDPNEWYVRHARRLLQERAAKGKLDPKVRKLILDKIFSAQDEGQRLRYLWTAHVTGGVDPQTAAKLLADKSEYIRAWSVQLLLEQTNRSDMAAIKAKLGELAKQDPSPLVRLYLASEVSKLAIGDRWPILEGLLSHAEDATDHNLPLMYWYGLEPMSDADPQRALALAFSASEAFPQIGQFMVRKLGGEGDKSLQLLVQGLAGAADDRVRLTFLTGLEAAMKGKRKLEAPKEWAAAYDKLKASGNARIKLLANGLALTFGMTEAVTPLRELVMRTGEALPQRREALAFLVKSKPQGALEVVQALLKDKDLRGEAIRGLAEFNETSTPSAILAVYKDLTPAEKRDALSTLSSRVPYAKAMLEALEAKTIASTDISADLIRQLKALNDADVAKLLESAWGRVNESSADRQAVIASYKSLITHKDAPAADLELGRALFAKTCQTCHTLFGTGAQIGPELTGANRSNLDYLLSNVLDPSAVLAKEYQPNIIETDSGRIITGIVKRKEGGALIVQTATELVTIPESEIEKNTPSPLSMMPEDQLKPFTEHEVRSLFAYLGSRGQSPLLATQENVANFFNGKDLTLWRGEEGLWKVEDGVIIGKTPAIDHNTFLMSEMAVEDFRLTLEVKLIGDVGNSGIQIRSAPLDHGEMKGYQCDIGPGWWGKLYEENGRALLWDKSGEAHVKKGEWNKYEIVAIGSRVRSFINDQPCVDLDDPEGARRGVIAFQMHSGPAMEVHFKNIKLEVLSQKPAKTSANLGFPTQAPNAEPKFKRTVLENVFRSEGATTGDFNNDGLLDIAAGSVWYEAPTWKMHSLLEKPNEFDKKTYGDTFCNFVNDFNKDGRLDLLVVDFPGKPTWWFENPGSKGGVWKKTLCVNETNNESPTYLDINKDGVGELIFGFEKQQMGLANPGAAPDAEWIKRAISEEKAPGTEKFSHGLGAGDINGDGLTDVVTTAGWWESPKGGTPGPWKFHAAPLGEPCSHMQVFDYDGDGDADILSASAHRVGVWYYEQTPEGWKTREIDKSCAQTHATCLADMNGDGLPDLVTGKRYYAHNGRDPGEDEPPMLLWYELKRENGKATWVKHIIDENSGVGTQFEVADVNRDGDLDIVIANKHGVFYFEQTRK